MGNKQSINQAFDLKSVNKQIYEQLTTNESISEANNTNVQNMKVKIGVTGDNCENDFSQKIDAKTVSDTTAMPETLMDMKNQIQQKLETEASANIESMTGGFSTAFGNKQETTTKVKEEIENIMETTFETENITSTVANAVNIQDGEIYIGVQGNCTKGGGIDFSQDIASEAVAQAVTAAITKGLQDNQVISDVLAEAEDSITAENRGPMESLGAMFQGMWWLFAVIGIVMVVACGGLAYVALSPAGQGAITTAANTASMTANPMMAVR